MAAARVEEAAVRAMLGAVDQDLSARACWTRCAARDGAALIAVADRMAERSLSFESALQELGTLLHRIALAQSVPAGRRRRRSRTARRCMNWRRRSAPKRCSCYYQIALQGRAGYRSCAGRVCRLHHDAVAHAGVCAGCVDSGGAAEGDAVDACCGGGKVRAAAADCAAAGIAAHQKRTAIDARLDRHSSSRLPRDRHGAHARAELRTGAP